MEADWSKMARLWRPDGVIIGETNELEVTANASGMQVFADTGQAWKLGFFYENTASVTIPIDAASAQDRIDRIVLRLDTTGNSIVLHVIKGTPAGSPAAPALQTGPTLFDVPLAQVFVDSAAVNIAAGDVTDERLYSLDDTLPRGVLDYAEITSAFSISAATTETDITGLSVAVTVGAGRRIRVSAFCVGFGNYSSPGWTRLDIREGGTTLQSAQVGAGFDITTVTASVFAAVVLAPIAGVHTYKVSAFVQGDTADFKASAGNPAFILVEDIGPA